MTMDMKQLRVKSILFQLMFLFLCIFAVLSMPKRIEAQGWCIEPIESPKPPEEDEDEKCKKCKTACKKSPCTVAKGNYGFSVVDLQIPTRGFPLTIKRTYNSSKAVDGLFGRGWTSNLVARLHYSVYLYQAPSTYLKQATIIMPDGETFKFTENTDGVTYTPSPGNHDVLIKNGDGTFDLTPAFTRSKYHFSAQGELLSMTDDYQNALNFSYSGGLLQQISDATGSGRYLNIYYGADGRISSVTDHTGRTVEYEYNPGNGALITFTDAASRDTHYDYHTGRFAPLLSQIKDHWNRVITDITWDTADRVQSYTEAGETYTYTYNYQSSANQTAKSDSSGNTWVFTYNSVGQVTQTDPPAGNGSASSVTSYNADGSVEYTIDEVGVKTSYTYNTNGTIATVTRDDGGPDTVRFDYSYDPNFPEKVIAITPKDPSNGGLDLDWQGQKFDYYQAGSTAPGALYHVYRIRNDGSTLDTLATYTYNSAGQLETITSATGGITTYGYNATTGDLSSITYPKNSTSGSNPVYGYGRDSLGRISLITNPLNKVTSFIYDNLDRVLTVTLPKPTPTSPNFVTTYTYDQYDGASGLLFIHITDENGRITKQGYDQFGQLRKGIDALNNGTIYAFTKGLLQSITDANGNVTGYSYNGLRQLTATNFADRVHP
jgi:YD repeat-containing protein